MTELNSIRLYLPDAKLRERIGEDVAPLADYTKALQAELTALSAKSPPTTAKGLFVTVGVKPGKRAKVWCEAVEGDIPADTLATMEKKLGEVPCLEVDHGPIAFALEIRLGGQKPDKFPVMPKAFAEAAERAGNGLLVPERVFKVIWPD